MGSWASNFFEILQFVEDDRANIAGSYPGRSAEELKKRRINSYFKILEKKNSQFKDDFIKNVKAEKENRGLNSSDAGAKKMWTSRIQKLQEKAMRFLRPPPLPATGFLTAAAKSKQDVGDLLDNFKDFPESMAGAAGPASAVPSEASAPKVSLPPLNLPSDDQLAALAKSPGVTDYASKLAAAGTSSLSPNCMVPMPSGAPLPPNSSPLPDPGRDIEDFFACAGEPDLAKFFGDSEPENAFSALDSPAAGGEGEALPDYVAEPGSDAEGPDPDADALLDLFDQVRNN